MSHEETEMGTRAKIFVREGDGAIDETRTVCMHRQHDGDPLYTGASIRRAVERLRTGHSGNAGDACAVTAAIIEEGYRERVTSEMSWRGEDYDPRGKMGESYTPVYYLEPDCFVAQDTEYVYDVRVKQDGVEVLAYSAYWGQESDEGTDHMSHFFQANPAVRDVRRERIGERFGGAS